MLDLIIHLSLRISPCEFCLSPRILMSLRIPANLRIFVPANFHVEQEMNGARIDIPAAPAARVIRQKLRRL